METLDLQGPVMTTILFCLALIFLLNMFGIIKFNNYDPFTVEECIWFLSNIEDNQQREESANAIAKVLKIGLNELITSNMDANVFIEVHKISKNEIIKNYNVDKKNNAAYASQLILMRYWTALSIASRSEEGAKIMTPTIVQIRKYLEVNAKTTSYKGLNKLTNDYLKANNNFTKI